MTERRPRTLPERERTDSQDNKVSIIGVDKSANTIYAQVNGCKITAVCREKADPEIKELYNKLRGVLSSFRGVSVEPKKLYIAFKAPKNFADVEVQKHNLKIFINMRKGTLYDPDELTDDVSNIGHWGNGDYRIYLSEENRLDYVIGLLKQSYENAIKNQE